MVVAEGEDSLDRSPFRIRNLDALEGSLVGEGKGGKEGNEQECTERASRFLKYIEIRTFDMFRCRRSNPRIH